VKPSAVCLKMPKWQKIILPFYGIFGKVGRKFDKEMFTHFILWDGGLPNVECTDSL